MWQPTYSISYSQAGTSLILIQPCWLVNSFHLALPYESVLHRLCSMFNKHQYQFNKEQFHNTWFVLSCIGIAKISPSSAEWTWSPSWSLPFVGISGELFAITNINIISYRKYCHKHHIISIISSASYLQHHIIRNNDKCVSYWLSDACFFSSKWFLRFRSSAVPPLSAGSQAQNGRWPGQRYRRLNHPHHHHHPHLHHYHHLHHPYHSFEFKLSLTLGINCLWFYWNISGNFGRALPTGWSNRGHGQHVPSPWAGSYFYSWSW